MGVLVDLIMILELQLLVLQILVVVAEEVLVVCYRDPHFFLLVETTLLQ